MPNVPLFDDYTRARPGTSQESFYFDLNQAKVLVGNPRNCQGQQFMGRRDNPGRRMPAAEGGGQPFGITRGLGGIPEEV